MLAGPGAERIREEARRGGWRNETLRAYLDRWATRRPGAVAFADPAGRLTSQELARAVERCASGSPRRSPGRRAAGDPTTRRGPWSSI
jgi:non-ribosomal peptide synthetase component E (peptide arylation enzyme)